jgi:hypothetical protein
VQICICNCSVNYKRQQHWYNHASQRNIWKFYQLISIMKMYVLHFRSRMYWVSPIKVLCIYMPRSKCRRRRKIFIKLMQCSVHFIHTEVLSGLNVSHIDCILAQFAIVVSVTTRWMSAVSAQKFAISTFISLAQQWEEWKKVFI